MILVPFELSISGKRTMWSGVHIGIPKWNRVESEIPQEDRPAAMADHPGRRTSRMRLISENGCTYLAVVTAASTHDHELHTRTMSNLPAVLTAFPAFLQALNDNPVGAVVIVALSAFLLVGFAIHRSK